jgi:hypothetical protein
MNVLQPFAIRILFIPYPFLASVARRASNHPIDIALARLPEGF